ncbi:PKS-ER domain-containing protein [Fusarium sp. LHS14.1]|nr:PKS-ER domain-containing protein [Fusarium sp. LHS14.1]
MTSPRSSIPSTMKAWRFRTAVGGAEKHMKLEDLTFPASFHSLPPQSSLIRVSIVSLNPVDIKFAETPLVGPYLHPMPAIPGLDGVGHVVKTTDSTLHVGQLAMFRLLEKQPEGALAEYVLVPSEGCVPVPDGVSLVQAATVGTCGVTACQAIAPFVSKYNPLNHEGKEPFKVFINGGSGGTGTFQIQIAKALGCYVVTSCSTPNVDLCKSLGADEVIDYRLGPVEDALQKMVQSGRSSLFDLVVDNVDLPWRLYKASTHYMKPEGAYVQIGGDVSWQGIKELFCIKLLPTFLGGGSRQWEFLVMKTNREDAERVLGWMQGGKIRIPIDEEFGFHEVPDAYRRLKAGRTRGKIIVHVLNSE